jgi:predicted aspartyl protease
MVNLQMTGLFCLVLAAVAQAQDCKPLALLTSVPMQKTNGIEVVEVGVNDQPAHFLLDTGGTITQLSRDLATHLDLHLIKTNLRLMDVTGNASQYGVRLDKFSIGKLVDENVLLAISPDRDFTKVMKLDGILSSNYFASYDVDFDFGASQLNFFSNEHCAGKIFYWKSPVRAHVPLRYHNGQIHLQVTIDGKDFDAILDTGASQTFMDAGTAVQAFGLKPDSADMEKTGPINGDAASVAYQHRFSTLSFEGVMVANPRIDIFADRIGKHDTTNDFQTGSHLKRQDDNDDRPQVTLGMNVLSKLHVYIAYKEKMAYITEAGTTSALNPVPAP